MKKALLLILLLVSNYFYLSAQAPVILWQKCYGGSDLDYFNSMQIATDSGYVFAGGTNSTDGDISNNHGGFDGWLVKTNSNGYIEWQKCLGGSDGDDFYHIEKTKDGGYVLAGESKSADGDLNYNHGDFDYWIVKTDSTGSIEWQKSYGGSGEDIAYSVQQTFDGGYIVAGNTSSADGDILIHHGSVNGWILKLDDTGHIEWQKTIYSAVNDPNEYIYCIRQTTDSGYLVCGKDDTHGYLQLKLAEDGSVECGLEDVHESASYYIIESKQGKYISAGFENSGVTGPYYNVYQADTTCFIDWQQTIHEETFGAATFVQETNDSGFITIGHISYNDPNSPSEIAIKKFTESGQHEWQLNLGGSDNDYGTSILQTSDESYILSGNTYSNNVYISGNHGAEDAVAIKLAPWGMKADNVLTSDKMIISPNPSDGHFTVTLPSLSTNVEITITNMLGQVVLQKEISKSSTEISLANVPGVYCILLKQGGNTFTAKLLVE